MIIQLENDILKIKDKSLIIFDAETNTFKKLIALHRERGYSLKDILEGMKKLEIVEIVLDKAQGDNPQVIFESINSTGLELSLADKIRNFVLMDDEKQDELFERYWLPLEELIGNKRLADFFIIYLDYKMSEKVSKGNAYDKFVKLCREKLFTHEEILRDLSKYAKYYAAFIGGRNTYNFQINKYLADFRAIDQSTLYIFLFDVFSDYDKNIIDDTTILKILSFFRSYCVRRIICEHASNSLRGLFKTLYNRLFKEQNFDKYYEVIYTFFKTTNTRDRLVEDDEFYDALIYKNLYTKKKVCKFLLSAIENEVSHEHLDVESLSIEHILPQKENAIVWKRALGENYSDVYNTYLHTLGNLTITGYNSELGTKSFEEKKKKIKEYSKARVLNKMILAVDEWNENNILNRAKGLADIVLILFAIEETEILNKTNLSSTAPLYNLDDIDIVKGTTPTNYSFYGENVTINNYSAMLSSVVNMLYDLDSSILEELAKEKFKVTSSDRVYITMYENELRRAKEISNTGIFYETNLSAGAILNFIKVVIEKHKLDPDEFEFNCK